MFDTLFGMVAPHLCCYCGEIGSVLCENCKYNIENERSNACVACGGVSWRNGICDYCVLPYSRAWCVGERSNELKRLIDYYKFEGVRAGYKPIANLLSAHIGVLPSDIIVVPIPTVASHRRQRGYDHTLLIAKRLARLQGLRVERALRRRTQSSQRGSNRSTRFAQAEEAFEPSGAPIAGKTCLLIDDVITTGATLASAARKLKKAGAEDVWVAVVARQPLD